MMLHRKLLAKLDEIMINAGICKAKETDKMDD